MRVRGDRNCLFRCVSKLLHDGSDEGHMELRRAACRWLIANQELVEAFHTLEQRAAEPVPQRAVRMSKSGQYAEGVEVMALAHLTGRSFLVYDVVEDTLLSLRQAQDGEEEPIMLCLSHADDHVLAQYNFLVPMNEGMPGHCPRGATHAQPPEASVSVAGS